MAAAILALGLTLVSCSLGHRGPESSATSSGWPSPSERASGESLPSPTDRATGSESTVQSELPPPGEAIPDLDLSSIGWIGSGDGYSTGPAGTVARMRMGLLDGSVDRPLEIVTEMNNEANTSLPEIAGPRLGRAVYLAEPDGASELHVITVPEGTDTLLWREPNVIARIVLPRSGEYLYYLLLERGTGRDLGIWRLRVDGPSSPERVALAVDRPVQQHVQTRMAVADDDSHVAATTCYGTDCVLRVVNTDSGEATRHDEIDGHVIGLTQDHVVIERVCANGPNCSGLAVEIDTGKRTELPPWQYGKAAVVSYGSRDLLLFSLDEYGVDYSLVVAMDLDSEELFLLGPVPGLTWLGKGGGAGSGVDLPPGWVAALAQVRPADPPSPEARTPVTYAIRVSDAATVRLDVLLPAGVEPPPEWTPPPTIPEVPIGA